MPRVFLCVWLWGSPRGSQLLDMSIGTYGHSYGCGRVCGDGDVQELYTCTCLHTHLHERVSTSEHVHLSAQLCMCVHLFLVRFACPCRCIRACLYICLPCVVLHCSMEAYVHIPAHLGIYVYTHESVPLYLSLCEYIHAPNQACVSMHLTLWT